MSRIVLSTLFIFLSISTLASPSHHVPKFSYTQGPNIPSIGSSLFDKIYSTTLSNGSAEYSVPYPLGALLDRVNSISGDFVHTMFPFSRSLQRPQDLSYNPITNPRIVLAPRFDKASLTRGKLFFGFVKAKDQLEVISFNDEAGRFEYQVITDYSKNPRVFYVDRGKCLSCHQGQAPIFSPPGWQDSTLGPMRHLIHQKLNITGSEVERRKKSARALFGSIDSREEVAQLDSLIRKSNDITLDERIWIYGCGQDSKCRLGLLLKTLSPTSKHTDQYISYSRKIINQSRLKKKGITFSSFLTSTDIGTTKVISEYGSVENVINSSEAILKIIGNLYNLPPADNPATKRPVKLSEKDLIAPLSGILLSDRRTIRKQIPSINQVAEILIQLYQENHPIFDANAINKLEIMSSILKRANSPKAKNYAFWIKKPTPEKILFTGNLPPVFQKTELNILSRHCHKCHAVGFKFPPQFLIGSEIQVLGKIKTLKNKLLFKLKNNLMPPNKSDRDTLRRSDDYGRLVKYVESL